MKYILLFVWILCSFEVVAQSGKWPVRGVVKAVDGTPVDAAVISGMSEQGKVLFQCIADGEGKFSALASEGKVRLFVNCLGYVARYTDWLDVTEKTDAGEIILEAASVELENVVVVGEKQHASIKMDNGNIVFTPKNSALVAGGSALDVLKRTPGVFVDGQNNLHIGGKGGVLVLLNGKNTYMQQEELTALLRSTPAESIESVEVMQQPPASYDAQGTGGIVNIRMKKVAREQHLYLSVNNGLSYWQKLRQNTEVSLGISNDKWRLSGGYGHTFGYYRYDYGMYREQGQQVYDSPTWDMDKRRTISSRMAFEYDVRPEHTLGAGVNLNMLGGPGITKTTTAISDKTTGQLYQTLYAENDYLTQKANRYATNLFYRFEPSQETWYEVDYDFAFFDGGSDNRQPNTYFNPDGTVTADKVYRSVNKRDVYMHALTYNQQNKLWGGVFNWGLKYSWVNADNLFHFYDGFGADQCLDVHQSNRFDYREQIGAAYIQYKHSIGEKWNVEAGLRTEYTYSLGELQPVSEGAVTDNKRSYWDFFPSLAVNYQLNSAYALVWNFNTRIDRPLYQNLNPFEYLLDELSCWKGNPFLKPQKSYQVGMSLQGNNGVFSLRYALLDDYSSEVKELIEGNKVAMIPRNVGKQHRLSLSAAQEINLLRWWNMRYSAVLFYTEHDLSMPAYEGRMNMLSGVFSVQSNMLLPWKIRMDMNGSYTTKTLAGNAVYKPTGSLDIGVRRKFCKDRLMFNLVLTDVFWTSRWDNYTEDSTMKLLHYGKSETRQLRLNVTYTFGKSQRSHQGKLDALDRL